MSEQFAVHAVTHPDIQRVLKGDGVSIIRDGEIYPFSLEDCKHQEAYMRISAMFELGMMRSMGKDGSSYEELVEKGFAGPVLGYITEDGFVEAAEEVH